MTSPDLVCVSPDQIDAVWPAARGLIKSAIDETGLSDFATFEREVLAGQQLLWLAILDKRVEAAATTHLVRIDDRKICVLTACAGHQRERWQALLDGLEEFAKAEGCALMRIYGRKGWQRVLEGYQVEHVVLEKELS